MDSRTGRSHVAACRCGSVVLLVEGPPIAHAVCHCESCQESGRQIGRLSHASAVLGSDGGTDCLLFRKDRVWCEQGSERLEEFRLRPGSPMRRMVAACCNTAMFLDLTKGHWLTLYRDRVAEPVMPLQMRIMTAETRAGVVLPNDVPEHPGRAIRLMWKLLRAWAAMGFETPDVAGLPRQPRAIQIDSSQA